MKPTTIREVLKEVLNTDIEGGFVPNEYGEKKISQAEAQLKELMIEWVGKDKDELKNLSLDNPIRKFYLGYNQRGAEITKRIKGI